MFVIYTKGNGECIYCEKAKALLEKSGHQFKENILGIHVLREHFVEMFPEQKTLPLIFDDGVKVGGFDDLQVYLEYKGPGQELLEE